MDTLTGYSSAVTSAVTIMMIVWEGLARRLMHASGASGANVLVVMMECMRHVCCARLVYKDLPSL